MMPRYIDNSPVEQTCPKINRVRAYIESIEGQDAKELQFIIDTIEEIREANSLLRDWGNEMHREKEEVERELLERIRVLEVSLERKEECKEECKEEIEELKRIIEDKDQIIEGLLAQMSEVCEND